ncbi:MAG TPA: DUF808 domain-containing protein [Burkholderiaceae bacterium]|nr:DUF808 domain-containing protein [Burkholderiaceae bacterium]
MAGASLLALIDDIATILDDVATMTKVAARKTAGVLGDDLALNAQQVSGVTPERELPVVWAVARGSLLNKVILVPAALAISAFAPWAVTPLLIVGGLYLCYEGVEKLVHGGSGHGAHDGEHGPDDGTHGAHAGRHGAHDAAAGHGPRGGVPPSVAAAAGAPSAAVAPADAADRTVVERDKIRGAVRTDFILSAEIIVISLGTVADAPMATRVAVLVGISLLMTVGVYGLVAGIVKLDDLGLHLAARASGAARAAGRAILRLAPLLMKGLSIAGTAAMFLVGGGILVHGVPMLHHAVEAATHVAAGWPGIGPVAGWFTEPVLNAIAGLAGGAAVLATVTLGRRALGR